MDLNNLEEGIKPSSDIQQEDYAWITGYSKVLQRKVVIVLKREYYELAMKELPDHLIFSEQEVRILARLKRDKDTGEHVMKTLRIAKEVFPDSWILSR